jgi:amino-acid N-acetyltransferase
VIELLKPTVHDIAAVQSLTADEIENGNILIRSDNDIATNIRSYTLAARQGKIVGCVALHIHTKELAEVRSLAVKQGLRGEGIGTLLVEKILEEAASLGIKRVFTLTYANIFFEKIGFLEIAKEMLPEQKIWADCIKCKHFPICNEIALIRDI